MKTIQDLNAILGSDVSAYRRLRNGLERAVEAVEAAYVETVTRRPGDTVEAVNKAIGDDMARVAVASLVNLNASDGRICKRSRQWAESVADAWDEESMRRMMIYTNRIHMAHLDQIAYEMSMAAQKGASA